MPDRCPLEKKIISYAFKNIEKDMDLDTAAFRILRDIVNEVSNRRNPEGLYERLFGKEKEDNEGS